MKQLHGKPLYRKPKGIKVEPVSGDLNQDSPINPSTTGVLLTEEDSSEATNSSTPQNNLFANSKNTEKNSEEPSSDESYEEFATEGTTIGCIHIFKTALKNVKKQMQTPDAPQESIAQSLKPTILVIDDIAYNMTIAEALIKRASPAGSYDFKKLLVNKDDTFEETMQKIRDIIIECDVRAIILDHDMGNTTGTDVIDAFNQDKSINLSIVALSSAEKNYDREKLSNLHINFMDKPLTIPVLKEFLSKIDFSTPIHKTAAVKF